MPRPKGAKNKHYKEKKVCTVITMRVDDDLLKYLKSYPSMTGYIRELIIKDRELKEQEEKNRGF